MSIFQTSTSSSEPAVLFWLWQHREAFLNMLERQGYAPRSVSRFRKMSARLCAAIEDHHLQAVQIDTDTVAQIAAGCPRTGSASMEQDWAMVTKRFCAYLVDEGIIACAPPKMDALTKLCSEFDGWLRNYRGMFGRRLRTHQNILRDFVNFCCPLFASTDDLAVIDSQYVLKFLEQLCGQVHWRVPYLRNVLRFLFWYCLISTDLSTVIPRTAQNKANRRPRHLEAGKLHQLLDAARGDTPRQIRDYAMLVMMARLGLRAQEIIAMLLEDIDWRSGTILIRGKADSHNRMPLPVDVGEALAAWLCGARRGNSRHVFVCTRPPYRPFTFSQTVRKALQIAYHKAGLTPPHGEVRTHSLRHSLAMNMLGQGASLTEISDVLRHHCSASTTVYARYDIESLRPLARRWPVSEVQS